jgi:cytochrome c-type biogenesis protein CcmH/NrfG
MNARIPSQKLDKLYALFSANQLEALERAARDCTRRHPAAAAGWQMLGASFLARRREQDALPHLQHAARLARTTPPSRTTWAWPCCAWVNRPPPSPTSNRPPATIRGACRRG